MTVPLLFAVAASAIALVFHDAIVFMVGQWSLDEFSHGYLIPFISAYLIWQRRAMLSACTLRGSWIGVAITISGFALEAVGRLSALFIIQLIGLFVVICGVVMAIVGRQAMRVLRAPLGVLVFMIPLPEMLLFPLSSELQLLSSQIGVHIMRWLGVSVLLQGNVIDLGSYKLEVAEACSGVRYLLPLMTLAFLVAYFYRAKWWKRVLLFLSSIPITLLMNGFRIAAIGVMVDLWGIGMAEGLLHQVQGWMVFMASIAVLLAEVALIQKLSGDRTAYRDLFDLSGSGLTSGRIEQRPEPTPGRLPQVVALAAVLLFAVIGWLVPARKMEIPARDQFSEFPLQIESWTGQKQPMESVYLDQLKLDDYLLADYRQAGKSSVNLYIAWYDTQSAGESTHSPRACLPGGGWRVTQLDQRQSTEIRILSRPLQFNRVVIEEGEQRELVYYWFMQRGRIVTSEFAVKWDLVVDSITKHRTDGALVRLIVPLRSEESVEDGDRQLQQFAQVLVPVLARYIPS